MKRRIDFNKFKKEAAQLDVSVHLLVRRYLNYRISKCKKNCGNCVYSNNITYPAMPDIIYFQCFWIGQSVDYYSNIDNRYICDYHKYSYEKGDLNDKNI